jgi:hypothetical protein
MPPIDSKRERINLLNVHNGLFPTNKAFDGCTLYSLDLLGDVIQFKFLLLFFLFKFKFINKIKYTEVTSKRESDGELIVIKIKKVGAIIPTSPNFVHLFNLVFRR